MGWSPRGQVHGAAGPSIGLSGSLEQGLDEISTGNSSTGQHVEQRHQEEWVCS